jgi:hypothetical protein
MDLFLQVPTAVLGVLIIVLTVQSEAGDLEEIYRLAEPLPELEEDRRNWLSARWFFADAARRTSERKTAVQAAG